MEKNDIWVVIYEVIGILVNLFLLWYPWNEKLSNTVKEVIGKIILSVVLITTIIVVVVTLMQPNKVHWINCVLAVVIYFGILSVTSRIGEKQATDEKFNSLTYKYLIIKGSSEKIKSKNLEKVVDKGTVLIPLNDKRFTITFDSDIKKEIHLRLLGTNLTFIPKINSEIKNEQGIVIEIAPLLKYAYARSLPPCFEIITK